MILLLNQNLMANPVTPKIVYKRLTPALRMKVICLHQTHGTYSEAAAAFNREHKDYSLTKAGVRGIVKRHGNSPSMKMESAKRSGRKRITSERDDRTLKRICLADRFKTAAVLRSELESDHGIAISTSTVKERLKEAGLMGRVARKKPRLTSKHRQARLEFAKARINWTQEKWSQVCYNLLYSVQ